MRNPHIFTARLAAILALTSAAACGLVTTKDQGADGGTTPATDGGTTPGNDGGTTPGADGGTPGSDGGTTPGNDGGITPPPPGNDGGLGSAASCSTATLFAGDPLYMDDMSPNSGTGILADPPLAWASLTFDGSHLYTGTSQELWTSDVSAASPVETRLAGQEQNDASRPFTAGACADARFGAIRGVGVLPDHSLVIADWWSNAILHVKDPTGAGCTVEYWAGSNMPSDNAPQDYNYGEVEGPGAQAKLEEPGWLVVDDAGVTYFNDTGTNKIKKVAADAAHTVSTLAKLPDTPDQAEVKSLTRVGSTVYVVATGVTTGYVWAVDTTTGKLTTLTDTSKGDWSPLDSSSPPTLSMSTTDGQGLIVGGSGYLWYVTTKGEIHVIAGIGTTIDFPPSGYDPKASHKATEVALEYSIGDQATVGATGFVAYHDGAIYSRGHGNGRAYFVEKLACP